MLSQEKQKFENLVEEEQAIIHDRSTVTNDNIIDEDIRESAEYFGIIESSREAEERRLKNKYGKVNRSFGKTKKKYLNKLEELDATQHKDTWYKHQKTNPSERYRIEREGQRRKKHERQETRLIEKMEREA